MNFKHPFLFAVLTLLSMTSVLSARTINWGSDLGSALYDSNGAPLNTGFIFEIGSFGTTFNPDALNINDWRSYWQTFDRATAPQGNGWNSAAGYFTSSATVLPDGTSSEAITWSLPNDLYTTNERAYIWVYNALDLNSSPEWALYTNGFDSNAADDWFFPASSDQSGLPLDWLLADATFTPFGGTSSVQGHGTFTNAPGTLDLQTQVAPIPEPSGFLLCGLLLFAHSRFRSSDRKSDPA